MGAFRPPLAESLLERGALSGRRVLSRRRQTLFNVILMGWQKDTKTRTTALFGIVSGKSG